jgi:hypothetical protein
MEYDPERGANACRRLAEAFAAGREPRSRDIREAMALAVASFPGLHDFVDAMEERELDPEDAMLDLSGIAAEHHGRLLEAAAKLALIGAIAEAVERFEWQDVRKRRRDSTLRFGWSLGPPFVLEEGRKHVGSGTGNRGRFSD